MKKCWLMIMGTIFFGLGPVGMHQVIKANQADEKTNSTSRVTSIIFLVAVIACILTLAFSMEIKTFLTQLF